jgi:hypothetical protein
LALLLEMHKRRVLMHRRVCTLLRFRSAAHGINLRCMNSA